LDLLHCLEGQDAALVIDAALPAGRPGTIRSFCWPCPELAAGASWSSHGLGLVEALRMAKVLGRLPRAVKLFTVEARDTAPCAPLSDALTQRLDTIVLAIQNELAGRNWR
jgi:hydrogenase maturation protease